MITQAILDAAVEVGEGIRMARLAQNITQRELSRLAGISLKAVRNIESGSGSEFKNVIAVSFALGQTGWVKAIAPTSIINPLTMTVLKNPRIRARK